VLKRDVPIAATTRLLKPDTREKAGFESYSLNGMNPKAQGVRLKRGTKAKAAAAPDVKGSEELLCFAKDAPYLGPSL
jgi:hypothetical protein